jgi:hypothetical protein
MRSRKSVTDSTLRTYNFLVLNRFRFFMFRFSFRFGQGVSVAATGIAADLHRVWRACRRLYTFQLRTVAVLLLTAAQLVAVPVLAFLPHATNAAQMCLP